MKVDKEYKLAYHTVVTALSCETNGTGRERKEASKKMFPQERMTKLNVPISDPDISF